MKLSELIEHFDDIPSNLETPDEFLVFNKYDKPFVQYIDRTKYAYSVKLYDDSNMTFEVKDRDTVDLEFLYYYLILNSSLLKTSSGGMQTFELEHLTIDFINNININNLPPIDKQYKLLKIIKRIYDLGIVSVSEEISKLFESNQRYLRDELRQSSTLRNELRQSSTLCNELRQSNTNTVQLNELINIKDNARFNVEILKANITGKYIEVIDHDIIMPEYLVYYLNYALTDIMGYKNLIDEYNRVWVELLPIQEQHKVVKYLQTNDDKIKNLNEIRKEFKSILRELILF